MKLSGGVLYALGAAALFGLSTPLSKLLLGQLSPLLLAGLLYFGSGIGLSLLRAVRSRDKREAAIPRSQWPWLAGAVLFGGALGPVLLLFGLRATSAASASLLLNLEGVFTALLAWFVFKENFDRRIALGMLAIVAGGVLLSWQGEGGLAIAPGALLVAGACLCWGIDNNLTQKVSSSDPFQIAAIKGLVAGTVNLTLAFALGATLPALPVLGGALVVGFFGYGLSLALFVLALRHLGTARTGAYFSLAPFVGAAAALLVLREPIGPLFLGAAALMGVGVWLHLTEKHEHMHTHEYMEHTHMHVHDEHHQHKHVPGIDLHEPHSHSHVHEPLTHSHPHFPDIHHRHGHSHTPSGEIVESS
ncbi:DMT family transporter [bacterium]|nr:MAG: DMT family transporter [bacterium]